SWSACEMTIALRRVPVAAMRSARRLPSATLYCPSQTIDSVGPVTIVATTWNAASVSAPTFSRRSGADLRAATNAMEPRVRTRTVRQRRVGAWEITGTSAADYNRHLAKWQYGDSGHQLKVRLSTSRQMTLPSWRSTPSSDGSPTASLDRPRMARR